MGRHQLPAEMIRQKEQLSLERQVVDFLRKKSQEEGLDRRKLIEEILVNWCTKRGLRLVRKPRRQKKVMASVS